MLRTIDTTSQRPAAGLVTSTRAAMSCPLLEATGQGTKGARGTLEPMTVRSFDSAFTATPAVRPYHVVTQLLSNDIAGSWSPKQKAGFSE